VHPFAEGVIDMVAVTGTFKALVAVNAGTSPVPFAPKPIDVLLFVQVNVVPDTGPVITVDGTAPPEQYDWLVIAFTAGAGLTVILKS
jgi:hypothetical protein